MKLRAERRAGEMLRDMAERGERDAGQGGDRKSQFHDGTVKLDDLGIDKKESYRWQKEATLPEDLFEEIIATHPWNRLTQANILRAVDALNYKTPSDVETPKFPPTQFRTIVIDPPWPPPCSTTPKG